jgi:site-specific DNA-methyltransferase (adenine-specific)
MRKFVNQILHGDCVVKMRLLPDGSIVFTLTSPPYDKIRKYGGHVFNFETFKAIAKELWRITAEGGIVIWVVQDQVVDCSFTATKHRQLLYFLELGFRLHNDLTLTTVNTRFPQRIRYTQSSHSAFVLSKGRPRVVNVLRDRPNKSAGRYQKKWGARSPDGTMRKGFYGKHTAPFGLRSDVWTYGVIKGQTTKDKLAHPDPMAEKRAEDLILSFSRPGDLVFDPMCGSGTTLKMALLNHRKYLGCEIHKPYWAEAVKRFKKYEEEYKKQLDEGFSPKILVPRLAQPPKPIKVPTIITPSKATIRIENADVLAVLKGLESNSFDGMLGAFPYALVNRVSKKRRKSTRGFMGKEWDGSLPSVEVCSELLRVGKPGAVLLAFGHPRTHHRLMTNIEDAGWIILDMMMWLYGQGKPACQDISKGIDRLLGAKREKVRYPRLDGFHETDGPIPVTPEAAAWLGYGTALKPAWEAVVVAMKPIEGSYAKNALKWGVAGLNIDESRIPCDAKATFPVGKYHADRGMYGSPFRTPDPFPNGRFPANVILDEEAGRLLDAQGPISKGGKYRKSGHRNLRHRGNLLYGGGIGGGPQNAPDTYGDAGGVSRFYYCAKASESERNAGLEGLPIKRPDDRPESAMGMWDKQGIQPQQNHHPCVKPLALCRYLARLILPPERQNTPRKLLVPYAGTGSEMIAAAQVGWDEILGIEIDPEYVQIAQRRIAHWIRKEVA